MNEQNESSESIEKSKGVATALTSGSGPVKKALEKGAKEILFARFSPVLLGAVGCIILAVLFIIVIFSVINPATLFTRDEPEKESIILSLSGAYNSKRKEVADYLTDVLNAEYGIEASVDELIWDEENMTYMLVNDRAEISVDFYPGLEEFAEQIDSYANAVNGLISLYGVEETPDTDSVNIEIEKPLTSNGELTDYGTRFVNSLESEYSYSQSDGYFESLKEYSDGMFSYEDDISKWKFENFHNETRTEYETRCYKIREAGGIEVETACELPHEKEKEISIEKTVLTGEVRVYMNVDPTAYKKDLYEKVIETATGSEMYRKNKESGEVEKVVLDEKEARETVETILDTYYYSYLSLCTGYEYTVGYPGKVTSSGYDYSTHVSASEEEKIAAYWKYSESKNAQLHNLIYRTDSLANGPAMNHQCTQFAATFFLDVYGFAALRGDGVNMADNLVKDCGKGSSAPIQFARSMSVSPGAIVSLYPNHVIVVDEVKEDGTIYISEGNYDGGKIRIHEEYKGGLKEYEKETGTRVKTIAVPINNPFEKEE